MVEEVRVGKEEVESGDKDWKEWNGDEEMHEMEEVK